MTTSKEMLDDIVTILRNGGSVCNRETAGEAIKKISLYRAVAEQSIGSINVFLRVGNIKGAKVEMDSLLFALDCIEGDRHE
jgi:hypothetical protein